MRKLGLISIFLISISLIGEDRTLESRLKDLIKLKDEAYRAEREKILTEIKDPGAFAAIGKTSTDWKIQIVANSMSSEKSRGDVWRTFYETMMGQAYGSRKSNKSNRISSDDRFTYIIMRCFGPDCIAPLGEILLSSSSSPVDLLDVLVQTRNDLSVDLLQMLIEDRASKATFRANALFRLGKCLEGIVRMECNPVEDIDEITPPPGPSIIPEELKGIAAAAAPRILPAWKLSGNARGKALKAVAVRLESDTDEQVRALAARILRFGDESTEKLLINSLTKDASQWVRAVSAESLGIINSESAKKAIEAARSIEKSEEVLLVLEGKAKVWPPKSGFPNQSILDRRNEKK